MKSLVVLLFASAVAAAYADAPVQPILFVKAESSYSAQGAGIFGRSTVSHRDQGMQAVQILSRNCKGLSITTDETKADFILMMNHQDDGSFGIGNRTQFMVSKKDGTLVKTSETQSVVGAMNNVCQTITGAKLHK